MKIHHMTAEEALDSLHSDWQGLAAGEAERRRREFGPNRVEEIERSALIVRFLKNFTHFLALILWLAAGLAFVAEQFAPSEGMQTLGWAIVGVIVINGAFSFVQEWRAERAFAALQKLLPRSVKVIREGRLELGNAEDLVPGDVVMLEDGDLIPADCRVLQTFGLRVSNATVTGESMPLGRDEQPSKENDLLSSRNTLLAGTSIVAGQGRAVVFATGMNTEFGRIAQLTQNTREQFSPLQREIARLSRLVAVFATGLGVLFFLIGQWMGIPFWNNFVFAIGIIVANVPEGLLPTVTVALALASQRMARRNALVRHLPAVETLGAATVICTDKTGTLTTNRLTVRKIFMDGEIIAFDPATLPPDAFANAALFLQTAWMCHDLKEIGRGPTHVLNGDPLEIALVEMARIVDAKLAVYPRIDEVPFDADRKRLSTLHRTPEGLRLYTKGALEMVLPLCQRVHIANKEQDITGQRREQFLTTQEMLASQGLRVLALAYRNVPDRHEKDRLETDLTLLGLVALEDPPRPEVPAAIQRCHGVGIRVIMITGDHPQTALAIGRQVGLLLSKEARIIVGSELQRLSDAQLQLALDAPEILFARVSADQKMRIVKALKAKDQIVAVTGDGVNDAPALRRADIGIAMGMSGTDVARESADMVLLDDNFATIVVAVEEGRTVFSNIRKFLTYILTSNVPELVPYLAFVLFKVPLALTIVQILAVDLGTDLIPALGLGSEKSAPNVMMQPPRSRRQRLLDWPLLIRSYGFLGLWESLGAMAVFFYVLGQHGWFYGQSLAWNDPLYLQATAACLSCIVVLQIVNVHLCRTETDSVFSRNGFDNRLIWAGIAMEVVLILAIDYTRWGNWLLATAPFGLEVWLMMIPFVLVMLTAEELRKLYVRSKLA
jgi:calcium-translocating P-type ATPase